jgi:hypothetical protein
MLPASNRATIHAGVTARKNKDSIQILVDAELKDVDCCTWLNLCFLGVCFDKQRSYLYLRENSLESNVALAPCWGLCSASAADWVTVNYFDRPPYSKECKPGPFPFCCFCTAEQPKLEIYEPGCMICCMKVNPCGDKKLVLMPFENLPIPCCCCSNRVTGCDNCFGLCGGITGNPKVAYAFFPQPTDPEGFVQVAQSVMLPGRNVENSL